MLQLNYKKYGKGKPLIILHGFLGSLDNWHSLSTEFGNNGFEVYAVDLRNHGRSPHTAHHSISLMVDDLKDFMMQQNLPRANLLGHSMGGKVVMQFALTYPEMVEKLIIVDMAPREYKHGHDDVFSAILNIDPDKIQSRKEAEEAMKPFLGDVATRQFVLKNLERSEEGKYQWKFNFETLYREYEEMLLPVKSSQPFDGETLFIRGENSIYIQEKDEQAIHQLFPHAKIETIEHAAHWVHADQPKLFFEAVKKFLS